MTGGYVYILGSSTGTLYIGVTSDIYHRIQQHKSGAFEGFSKTYGCTRLLYVEPFELMLAAIAREKQLKGWRREKKLNLIRGSNPEFKRPRRDLGLADNRAQREDTSLAFPSPK